MKKEKTMTLQNLLYKISEIAIAQDIIHFAAAGTDIYALNALTIKDWPVLFTSPTGSHNVKENTTEFSLTFYYLDRLLEGNSNELDILSVSIEQLKSLLKIIAQIDGVVNIDVEYQITNFTETEAFNDRVCGAYTTVMVEVVNDTICA